MTETTIATDLICQSLKTTMHRTAWLSMMTSLSSPMLRQIQKNRQRDFTRAATTMAYGILTARRHGSRARRGKD